MKAALICLVAAALCLAACGRKEAPAEKDLETGKKVTPAKTSNVDPGVQEDLDNLTWLDEVAGEEAGPALEGKTSLDDQGTGKNWLLVELTAAQREDLERQRRANRASARRDVTVKFTPEQLEAIRRVCPACKETSITWHTDRVGVRVKLYFDEAGRIVKPLEPFPYVSR